MTAFLVEPFNGRPGGAGKTRNSKIDLRISGIHADEVPLHPLVEQFPELPKGELALLAERIRDAGSCAPFLLAGGKLIDDRNRYAACILAGVRPEFRQWSQSPLSIESSLAETAARLNLPALHLEESQRACIAVPIAEAISAENRAGQSRGLRRGKEGAKPPKTAFPANPPVSLKLGSRGNADCKAPNDEGGRDSYVKAAAKAAEICHVSRAYVEAAKKLRDDAPQLFHDVRLGKLNLNQARLAASKKSRCIDLFKLAAPTRQERQGDLILLGDCLKIMPTLKRGSADLICTDPPYNNRFIYDADPTFDKLPDAQYYEWSRRWMSHCRDLLSPAGSIFVVIDANWCGRFDSILRELGLHFRNVIAWWEHFPQDRKSNLPAAARFVLYFTRSPKRFTWNWEDAAVPTRRSIIDDQRRAIDVTCPHNVWPINRQTGNGGDAVPYEKHPPQLPAKLLQTIIKLASNPGDFVLDPFAGNGTTIKAALELGRRAQGIERSPLYAKQAAAWIASGNSKLE
ncbi:MAG: site-specific DNA-methyltransferase [Tepidisphaeraceae bacterium]|jgi:site-specific DNA-methyltransferase (adenine-specific)